VHVQVCLKVCLCAHYFCFCLHLDRLTALNLIATLCVNACVPMCATICCVQLMCAFERRQPEKLSVSFRLFAYVLIIVCVVEIAAAVVISDWHRVM